MFSTVDSSSDRDNTRIDGPSTFDIGWSISNDTGVFAGHVVAQMHSDAVEGNSGDVISLRMVVSESTTSPEEFMQLKMAKFDLRTLDIVARQEA